MSRRGQTVVQATVRVLQKPFLVGVVVSALLAGCEAVQDTAPRAGVPTAVQRQLAINAIDGADPRTDFTRHSGPAE